MNLYKTTKNYIDGEYTQDSVVAIIKEISDDHIWVKKIIDKQTRRKVKKANRSWAINYKGGNYFNLGYSEDLNKWNVFIKFDIEGINNCASFIDNKSPKVIQSAGGNYGGGLQGVLLKNSKKWNKNWEDETGTKRKILFLDLTKINKGFMSRHPGSIGNLLSRKEVKELFGVNIPMSEIKKMTFEEIVSLIHSNNEE